MFVIRNSIRTRVLCWTCVTGVAALCIVTWMDVDGVGKFSPMSTMIMPYLLYRHVANPSSKGSAACLADESDYSRQGLLSSYYTKEHPQAVT